MQRIHPSKSPQTRQSGKLCNCVLKGVESGKASLPVDRQLTDHFEIMPATAKPATSTTSTAGIGAGRWSGSMSVDLEVPEMGSSSGSRSSFEIHTSGAKPETSTAIVCTGPHFFKLFHDSKSGTSKLCPGLPNRLPAPPARRSPKATRARIPKRDNREKGARSEVGTRRSRFEIHTSGAKPETSTAIICTGARCRRCAIVASADLHPHPLWFEHRALARLRPHAKEPDHTQKSYTI